ncbi:hypothetical protein PHMEG_00038320 [Phytophthora megakarya]|uniref:Uncharacterized protein n=1 Tax=Phytophthora megakarya TaxID=4795 RepID=A0A225UHD6_9STRA|nr:hypothetical protein PHMEG_00038320 [Phytophthora megakarya]
MLTLPRECCCLLHTNSTVMCNRDDLIITNSNFIDSGATMNAVSPEFCERTGLRDSIKDHGVEIPIVLANRQEMKIPKQTLRLHLYIEDFDPYIGDFSAWCSYILCKKTVGWRIEHDYRAINSHTVRRTLPMPRKDTIIEKMQGSH